MSSTRTRICLLAGLAGVTAASGWVSVASAPTTEAATSYQVRVTCTVPKGQPERQLAPNSCLNYIPDGTQTYNARVRNSSGNPVAGVWVQWTDSNSRDARFRPAQTPCKTNLNGVCSAELVDTNPQAGERITVRATVGGSSAAGYLTFRRPN
ncbi:MAG TPA: Ig-like domain-containing protein [Nocardioidaceae bacterium]|nr:Ig-like domain-containing protein [Nocardioidaceae bacterium]